jgi:hypothetical protein
VTWFLRPLQFRRKEFMCVCVFSCKQADRL